MASYKNFCLTNKELHSDTYIYAYAAIRAHNLPRLKVENILQSLLWRRSMDMFLLCRRHRNDKRQSFGCPCDFGWRVLFEGVFFFPLIRRLITKYIFADPTPSSSSPSVPSKVMLSDSEICEI